MSRPRRIRPINHFFRFVTIFPIAYFILLVVVMTTFSWLFARTDNYVYLFIVLGFGALMLVLYVIYTIYVVNRFHIVIIEGIYNTTVRNFESLTRNEGRFLEYPNKEYEEINTLNERVDILKKELTGATLIPSTNNFDDIGLDYWNKEKNIVTFESFKRELPNIIFKSQNYRNIIIEVYYELTDEDLTQKDVDYIIGVLNNNFHDYELPLYILADDRHSIYLYLPRIDTLSKINEQLETCLRQASITRRLAEGIAPLAAHFSVVCYPYSDVNELLPDLRYAKRLGESIYFYLPNRLSSLKNIAFLRNSMNINAMSKIIDPLLNMDSGLQFAKENARTIENVLKTVALYFGMDHAGIIGYDDIKREYHIVYRAVGEALSENDTIEREFVQVMDDARDNNNSYYFSSRNHANNALGRHLDRIGLESGFYYVVREDEVVIGVIYFFNKNKEFFIDSYIQEALVVLCNKVTAYILNKRRDLEVESSYNEIDALLKLSDFSTYRISPEDNTLLRVSSTMKNLFPKLEIGAPCYHTLYGLDEPCKDCPLLTGNKKEVKIGNNNYETSLVLSETHTSYRVLALKNLYNHKVNNRYNQDMVINSFHSLVENLEDIYRINGKGYLLLLRIDNLEELVTKLGSEGYLSLVRDFVRRVKKLHNGYENIYYYTNQFLAILYPEFGQTDILDECEKIYNLAQNNESGTGEIFNITFLPVSFPRVYPNASSLIKQADSFSIRGKYAINKDFIYFDESNYSRSANREQFLLAVIQKAFSDKTFEVNLQPMVNAVNKRIYGAELLLRISDEYRNTTFRTDELVNVAAKHNQIGIISHALLDYIGSLYTEFGASFFSSLGFKRLGLNTDYSFFTDKNFRGDMKKFLDSLKLPKNFIAFEIPESDVSTHIEEFKEIAKMTKDLNIVLVCDQYTGRNVSLEILKDIGFNEVKISRNLVLHIDSDNQRYANLKQLLHLVHSLGLKASVVGVENIDQYLLIKQIDDSILLQGFYFHRPLEKQALIETVRSVNRRRGDDSDSTED